MALLAWGASLTLNIQRLVYQPSDVVWDAITFHLPFVLHHPAVPPPIHVQTARALVDIHTIVPRSRSR